VKRISELILVIALLLTALPADNTNLPQCNNQSTCVNDKNFYVEVKRVVKRGDVYIVQLEFRGKTSRHYYMVFTQNSFKGYASILDAKGNEFIIPGDQISDFYMEQGDKKVVSFKFKGDEKKKIAEPFDLTIKTKDDEFTLFDLKGK